MAILLGTLEKRCIFEGSGNNVRFFVAAEDGFIFRHFNIIGRFLVVHWTDCGRFTEPVLRGGTMLVSHKRVSWGISCHSMCHVHGISCNSRNKAALVI